MTAPNADRTDLAGGVVSAAANHGAPALTPPETPKGAKSKSIHVSPAVLNAARKSGEELLRELRTSPAGLTQAEAEERARATGPNEIAQEKVQGWPVRLLKIMRNPLVILLATLSSDLLCHG